MWTERAENSSPTAATRSSRSKFSQCRERLPAEHVHGKVTRSRIGLLFRSGRPPLCPSPHGSAALIAGPPSFTFLLPNALKQAPLSRATINFLKQLQRRRALQKRIGTGRLTVLESSNNFLVGKLRGTEAAVV